MKPGVSIDKEELKRTRVSLGCENDFKKSNSKNPFMNNSFSTPGKSLISKFSSPKNQFKYFKSEQENSCLPFAADKRNRVEKKTSQFNDQKMNKYNSLTMTRFGRKVLNAPLQ